MQTLVTDDPSIAATFILKGQLAAFPTETVYGLGGDALDPSAVAEIYRVKGRPSDNPLIVHLASVEMISIVAKDLTPAAHALIDRFIPGPLTVVARRSAFLPDHVSARLDTVAFRIPSHPVARAFLEACDRPVAAPSANKSGRPSPTKWEHVLDDFDGQIACVLKGGRSDVGLESTVVDCTRETTHLLREGAVGLHQLRQVIHVEDAPPGVDTSAELRSPGLRHRHYAPRAKVVMMESTAEEVLDGSAYIGMEMPAIRSRFVRVLVCAGVDDYARELYSFFRECDRKGIPRIYCGAVPPEGIGRALTDRIRRASES